MNNTSAEKPSKNWLKYLPLAVFVIAAVIYALTFNIEELKTLLDRYEKYGLVICTLAYVLLGVTPIPSDPVTFLLLAWKGPTVAILLSTFGNTLAALVEFHIGGSIGQVTDFEQRKENLPFHLGRLPITSPLFLLLVRMIPGFGPKFVSIAGGVYRVPMITYLWTTIVANLLGAIMMTLAGMGLIHLFH